MNKIKVKANSDKIRTYIDKTCFKVYDDEGNIGTVKLPKNYLLNFSEEKADELVRLARIDYLKNIKKNMKKKIKGIFPNKERSVIGFGSLSGEDSDE